MQKRLSKSLILLVFILWAFGIALGATAETKVIGFIAQDTTWTQANSPYVTLGNIIVKEGVTLTIKPGVTVQFDSGYSLTIEGTLIARGIDKQGIKFTPKGDKKPEAWGGIMFRDSSTDAKFDDGGSYVSGSILQYCVVEFAETAVYANSASPFIDHCVISNNQWGGVSIYNGDIIVIQNSTVADNIVSGISVTESENVILIENTVTGNYGYGAGGIRVKGDTVTISDNTLTGNTGLGIEGEGGGIYVEGDTVTISDNTLTGNTARNFSGGGICVRGGATTISYNTLIGNTATGSRDGRGGGIHVSGTATISDNTITGNTASDGGGIYAVFLVTITGNTITENRISNPDGAAIHYRGSQDITGNFIANNVAEGNGNTNAVYIDGNPTFTGNTIIGNQTKFNLYYAQTKGLPNLNATNNYWGVTTEVEIRGKIHDFFADMSKAIVDVIPFLVDNPLPLGSLTVVVSPKMLPADGKSTATITATLKDSKGNPVVDESPTMVVSQGTGKLSEMKNNGDGTYTAIYTTSRTVGSEIIWVAAPNSRLAKSIEIQLTEPGVLPPKMFSILDTEAAAGGTVDIPVEIDDITSVAKAEIELSYDAKFLEAQGIDGTELLKELTLTTKADVAGKLTISLAGAEGLSGGSGVMFHVTFKIAEDAPVGTTEIKLESIALSDEFDEEIPATSTNGTLNVTEYQPPPEYPPWDVNEDGVVDIADLVLVGIHFGEDYRLNAPFSSLVGTMRSKNAEGDLWLETKAQVDSTPYLHVQLKTTPINDLYGYQFDLSFDPTALELLTVTASPLLERDGTQTYWTVSKRSAVISAMYARQTTRKGINADGTLATIAFRVKDVGHSKGSPVYLANIKLADSNAQFIPVNIKALALNLRRLFIPAKSMLAQNYPNPFNPETWLPYQLASDATVTISIYNTKGQLIRMLHLGAQKAGHYMTKARAAYWEGRDATGQAVSSGLYFYQLKADDFSATRKMAIVK